MFKVMPKLIADASKRQLSPVSRHFALGIFAILAFYFGLTLFISLIRYWTLGYGTQDIGNFRQILWYAANGHMPMVSLAYPYKLSSWFGFHFSIVLFAAAPIYKLFPYGETLCVLHTLSITVSAIPAYAFCRRLVGSDKQALLWMLAYLCNIHVFYTAIFSFQDHTFAVPIVATALWALTAQKRAVFIAMLILLALCKEHFGVTSAMLALLWAWIYREWKLGGLLAIGFIAYVIMLFGWVMPSLSALGTHTMLAKDPIAEHYQINRYAWIVNDDSGFLGGLLNVLFSKMNLEYAVHLMGPFLFMPLVAFPYLSAAASDLAANFLSSFQVSRRFYFYHSSCIIPVLLYCSAVASVLITRRYKGFIQYAGMLVLVANILFIAPKFGSLVEASGRMVSAGRAWSFMPAFKAMEAFIPADANVATIGGEGTFLAHRPGIYPYVPELDLPIDYVVMNLWSVDQMIWGRDSLLPPRAQELQDMLTKPGWGIAFWQEPWVVFKKGADNVASPDELRRVAGHAIGYVADFRDNY